MKTYSQNPWVAQDIADFNFLCCPECTYKSKVEEVFIEHAIEIHPKSKFSKIFNLQNGTFLSNQNIENEDRIIHCPTDTISIDMVEENIREKYQLAMSEDCDYLSKVIFDEDYYEKGKFIQLIVQVPHRSRIFSRSRMVQGGRLVIHIYFLCIFP